MTSQEKQATEQDSSLNDMLYVVRARRCCGGLVSFFCKSGMDDEDSDLAAINETAGAMKEAK